MSRQRVRIKLKAFDVKLLDKSMRSIILAVKRVGAKVSGPVLLPIKKRRFILNRSPHVDKKSREQFEIRSYSRLVNLPSAGSIAIQALMNLQLPAGVDVEIKVEGGEG